MLVFSRDDGEQVIIGDNIKVTVVKTANGRVRLGFDAPRHIPIHRQEVKLRALTIGEKLELVPFQPKRVPAFFRAFDAISHAIPQKVRDEEWTPSYEDALQQYLTARAATSDRWERRLIRLGFILRLFRVLCECAISPTWIQILLAAWHVFRRAK